MWFDIFFKEAAYGSREEPPTMTRLMQGNYAEKPDACTLCGNSPVVAGAQFRNPLGSINYTHHLCEPCANQYDIMHSADMYKGEPMDIAMRLLKEEEKDYNPYSENEEDLMSAPWDLQMAIQEQAYALAEQNTPWDKEKYPTWHDWQEAIEVEGEINLAHMMMSPEYGYLREWYHQLGKAPDSYGWATQEDMGMKERDNYLDYHKDMGIPLPGESFAIDIPGIDEPMEIENHPQGHKENPFKPTMYEKDGKPTWPLGVVYNEETGFTRSEPMEIAMQLLKERVSPEAKRHKLEYDKKYESSPERVKYREELNRERRRRHIMGQGGPDMSHTSQHTIVPEDPHTNRARHFKDKGTLL